ncbi:MAG: PspC domain-containing protein [Desulfobacterales bacterium]|jgi:phage shock protein C
MSRFNSISKRGLYRSRNGVIFGVFRGLADYFDFSVFWIRAIAVVLFLFTGFWPVVGIYILAALLMKSDPAKRADSGPTYRVDRRSRCMSTDTAERLKRKWKHLEKRIRKMEDKVTSRQFDWNSRFHDS